MIVLYIYIIINALKVVFLNLDGKVSYPGPYGFVDLIPRDPSWYNFHYPGSFFRPWYPALKMSPPYAGLCYFHVFKFVKMSPSYQQITQ